MKKVCRLFVSVIAAALAVILVTSPVTLAVQLDEESTLVEEGLITPKFTEASLCKDGVKLSWEKIDGIGYYRLYRWFDNGRGWTAIKDTDALSYTDTDVASGKSYRYRICGISSKGSVLTPTATVDVSYIAPTKISYAENTKSGIRLHWSKPEGVDRVAVLKMTDSGYTQLAVTDSSSYLDESVSFGGEYRYTVRAINTGGAYCTDYYDEEGVLVKRLTTPNLSVESAVDGVEVSWDNIDGAELYRVFVKTSNGWSEVGETASSSFLDTSAKSGQSYTYTVRCVSADKKAYTSYFDTNGKSLTYVATPALRSATATVDGIRLSWDKCDGAYMYRLFYKNRNGDWVRLADTSAASYTDTDVSSGDSFVYTVRCIDKNGNYVSSFDRNGIRGGFLSAPVISSVSSGADGVDISWGAVNGAELYRVYYYGSKGWTRLEDTTETHVTDTDVSSGYTYTYTVRCLNADATEFTSDFLSGKSVKYIAAPVISSLSSTENGVNVSWGNVRGADKYRVYRMSDEGWTRIADTSSASYLDKNVDSGKKYTYTVRCINSAATAFQSYFKPGVSTTFVKTPEINSVVFEENALRLHWTAVDGAELYRLYCRTDGGWTKILDTTDNSYSFEDVVAGTAYKFTVRCLTADGTEFTSDYIPSKSYRFVPIPHISSVSNGENGVNISWGAVKGAANYRVYYYGDRGWTKVADTADTTLVHTSAQSGTTYRYTVRCVSADGSDFESGFDNAGKSVHYIAAPQNLRADSDGNAIKISWTESKGAELYRVYYYGRKGWTKLTETTSTSVVDDDITSGYTYRYTVRCITADGESFTSDYNRNGVTYKYTDVPKLTSADCTQDGGIKITWSKSSGAEKYRVYYYGRKGWTKLADTTSTSIVDSDVSSGYTYRYTVRCIKADGSAFTSDCDMSGISCTYCSSPKLIGFDTTSSTVSFTWSKPSGASKYRVYKKVSGSWVRLADTANNTYKDNSVSEGKTYVYTVRVISPDGSQFCSGYDANGFVVTVVPGTKDFYYYDQCQYDYPYGDDTIAYSGCGPTSFAMIASTVTGKSITPIDAVSWCGNKYYVYNVGTMWNYFSEASKHFGVGYVGQTYSFDQVTAALKKGQYVISAQSRGIFTRGGHFIVLAGIDSDGKYIVYDPNGGNRYVGTSFSRSDITASGTSYWIFDKK